MPGCNRSPRNADRLAIATLLAVVAAGILACAPIRDPGLAAPPGSLGAGGEAIRISGSDTMLQLVRLWAERFMRSSPGIPVYVWGGGSARGIDDLLNGRVDLCAVSRPPQAEEARLLASRHGATGMLFAAAKEALSIYAHPDNPVRDLSLAQIRQIFTGEIRNWRDVGGTDLPIRALRRASSSGTFLYFQEHVLDGEAYGDHCEVLQDTMAIVSLVRADRSAIGYGGIAHGTDLHIRVDGVAPTEPEIRSGAYPITRYLYLLAVDRPNRRVQNFLDWVQGSQGQQAVRDAGMVALW